jgi:NAD(P)-dependent dehydrogenase (short-subunit alcohol dehydrogenase family)
MLSWVPLAISCPPGSSEPTVRSLTLTGRRGVADDMAATMGFLCGAGANYITGHITCVSGGTFQG